MTASRTLGRGLAVALAVIVTSASAYFAAGASPDRATEKPSKRGDTSSGEILIAAHRGSSAMAPPNTLPAFSLGIVQDADLIEFDLHLTADDEIVLVHDTVLDTTTNVREVYPDRAPWRIRDFTLEEIKQLDAGASFNPRFAGEQVPTLREAIELIKHRAGVQLDVKSPHLYPGISERIMEELEAVPGYLPAALQRGSIQVLAFDREWLFDDFGQVAPDGITLVPMWGAGSVPSRDALEAAREYTDWMITAFDNVANHPRLRDDLHDLGFSFGLYTLNDAERMYDAYDYGAAAIATDYPTTLRELIDHGLLGMEFEPPVDDREDIVFESGHYRVVITTSPDTRIEQLGFDPAGQGQYREVLNHTTRGTVPFVGIGQFSPVLPVGEPEEIVLSDDGRDLALRGIPMLGEPIAVDWTFRFEDEWFDHEMTWTVDGATSEPVYQVGWGIDAGLTRLGDNDVLDRERGHARPFSDWSVNWDDNLTVVAAYENGSAWAEDNVFFSTAHNFVAWTPLWESGGRDWAVGEYDGGRWRIGASGTGGDEAYANQLHADLNN
ncbi:glycerophosphodiester phosphodiesterase [Phytoactinopolyspora limicola]|uniref:glycerophosphodiester phosphodiesterase n=1 Tax=Phytoactinopolyspora limicola TaxID=2715536 RepID=UPI001408E382|nr:glycerophosphodiester phosphodiesterase family protein [Phytoactinopolyspora limicola]